NGSSSKRPVVSIASCAEAERQARTCEGSRNGSLRGRHQAADPDVAGTRWREPGQKETYNATCKNASLSCRPRQPRGRTKRRENADVATRLAGIAHCSPMQDQAEAECPPLRGRH